MEVSPNASHQLSGQCKQMVTALQQMDKQLHTINKLFVQMKPSAVQCPWESLDDLRGVHRQLALTTQTSEVAMRSYMKAMLNTSKERTTFAPPPRISLHAIPHSSSSIQSVPDAQWQSCGRRVVGPCVKPHHQPIRISSQLPPRRIHSGLLALPCDVWTLISDFAVSVAVRRLCRWIACREQERMQQLQLDSQNVKGQMETLTSDLCVHTVYATGQRLGNIGTAQLRMLGTMKAVRTIKLNLNGNNIGPMGAAALEQLKSLPSLTSLTLDLGWNRLEIDGLLKVFEVRAAPMLTHLDLNLNTCSLHTGVANAVGSLAEARRLQALTLNLGSAHIHDARGLERLSQCSSLEALDLRLPYCQINDDGVIALASVLVIPTMKDLAMDLSSNDVSYIGAAVLARARRCAGMQRLKLNLQNNPLTEEGYKALMELLNIPSSTSIEVMA